MRLACPSHTIEQEREVEDYRRTQLERSQELKDAQEEQEEQPDELNVDEQLKNSVGEIVDKLMYQIDVASAIYVGYVAISLFFPTPLKVFRPHYGPMVKGFLFGANKMLFIAIVLAIWWYVRRIEQNKIQ